MYLRLYAAKFFWYADMLAFRDLGSSMTGAGSAALPLGPQLNNGIGIKNSNNQLGISPCRIAPVNFNNI